MTTLTHDQFREIFPAFRSGDGRLISEILAVSEDRRFQKDLQIYSEGDVCSAIALLLEGEIRVYRSGSGGREITLYEIERGETCILNASCILSNIRYPANAVTTSGGRMLLIPAHEFRRLISEYTGMRDFVFSVLSERLSAVMALVEEVAFGRMDRRLLDYLVEKSEQGDVRATHQKIADDLGTSREVVSRILKDFERKGLISLSRNLVRLNS